MVYQIERLLKTPENLKSFGALDNHYIESPMYE